MGLLNFIICLIIGLLMCKGCICLCKKFLKVIGERNEKRIAMDSRSNFTANWM